MVFTDCESCTRPISTNPGSMQAGEYWANTWDVFRRTPSRGGHGRRAAVDFVVCFGCRGISFFFSWNAHGLLQVWGRLASFTFLLVVEDKSRYLYYNQDTILIQWLASELESMQGVEYTTRAQHDPTDPYPVLPPGTTGRSLPLLLDGCHCFGRYLLIICPILYHGSAY